ncbi:methanethiol oxidase [Methylomarinovum caldicuralii]|uniref:Methanethiol oxidase n=1 Tax=Methylomarinovum caldicuralii TaxID=438856 RepID=A0AAU9C0A8_9GAMM|nr:selenium-binding protein SBP56-related protein [Methylomarinovum caldicuralii]BCX82090.1 methanethiol oxidase [Methylomarinovum caldicuralii]
MIRMLLLSLSLLAAALPASADETPLSPYMPKIVGQEDFIYVWTLGIEGLGDGSDKLVTIDANPKSKTFGKVIHTVSVGGRHEAHHSGFTDDRNYLWAGGLDTSKIFIFDVHTNPARPKLVKVIDDFVEKSGGVVGPHTTYALPGRMIISGLSNDKDYGGRTALVEYTNDGQYVATYWMPTDDNLQGAVKTGKYADGYGYDVRALPRLDIMLTSSFTGHRNYMRDLGELMQDKQAMQEFGKTMVLWDLHDRKPKLIFDVPGSPLEIRCAWEPNHNYCFTSTALTAKIWLVYLDDQGKWHAQAVADIGDPAKIPLPVDISIESDDRRLWVTTFMDGNARLFDISDPFHPKQIYQKKIGSQVNMVSQSWDGKRVYFSSSLLSKWDKKGKDNEQFVKAYRWDGKELTPLFQIDFLKEKLGRPHQMRFGAYALYR